MKYSKGLHKYKIISIVGAGGKTSLMYLLSKELGEKNRVLMTTTTKIFVPQASVYRKMEIGNLEDFLLCDRLENGIYVYGNALGDDNKLLGASEEEINLLKKCFDYIIIESDGSKQKPLKAWREDEPVIYSGTNLTIGVIDIQTLGKNISRNNIHRLPLFLSLTESKEEEKIELKHLIKVITSKEGLYKNSIGEKMLFINKVESSVEKERAYELVEGAKKYIKFKYAVIGSVKENKMIFI